MKFSPTPILVSAMLLCTGCTESETPKTVSFFAMDTAVSVTVPNGCDTNGARDIITALSDSLDCYKADSMLTLLNETGQTSDIELAEILTQTAVLSERFGSDVSLSCGAVTRLWGISTDTPTVPSASALESALATVDDTQIQIDGADVSIPSGTALDLGSVAKGYALDRVQEQWKNDGIPYGICSMHSAVLLYGEKPDGSLFTVQIQSPEDASETLGTVSVPACFVATAGGYERYFTADDGKEYCHIIDLSTGYPTESDLTTVTVFTDNGLKADYLSTLIYLQGTEKIQTHLNAEDYQIIAADTSGTLYISEGLTLTGADT